MEEEAGQGVGEAGPARAASVFVFDPPGDRPSQVWPISEWENGRFYEGPVIRFGDGSR